MASHDPSESARALHVFFAPVYGAQLTIEEIAGEKHITPRLLDVCAYAEFWGCLDAIGPTIARAFPTNQHGTTRLLYKTVARSPKAYAILAKKLHIEVLYHDALRRSAIVLTDPPSIAASSSCRSNGQHETIS
jgi:hypothetical protein